MHVPDEVGLGVIGCGGFGLFALQHFAQVPGVRLAGMAGTHREAALAAARRFGLENVEDQEAMLQRDDVDLVYIATPPFLHYEQAMMALAAGKHVICEKPLATTLDEADEMIAAARQRDLLLVANLMQRYNPLADSVQAVIERRILGDVLHGYFENYAADEGLAAGHWFWDRDKSGGIFIEHGVHFFDLFSSWLGGGEVVSAQAARRPGTEIEEQVQCTVRYRDGVLVNFYHGFHQPGRLDRQELRLVFERGDITLYEWIPSRYRIHAIVDEAEARALCDLFPDGRLDVSAVYPPKERQCQGRHNDYDVFQAIELTGGFERPKMHRYGDLLRAMLSDQLAWLLDRSHARRINEENGRDSLAMAVEATSLT
jgi:predicted dehydrogenase